MPMGVYDRALSKRPALPALVRFWAKVKKTPTCWLWTASTNQAAYGQFWIFHRTKKTTAHRFAYEQEHGPIPSGLEVHHLCGIRNCVNPEHLKAVTHRENILCSKHPSMVTHRSGRCGAGHPYTPENGHIYRGKWHCRVCKGIRNDARRAA